MCVDSSYAGYSLTVYADTVTVAGFLSIAGLNGTFDVALDALDGADSGDLKIVARRVVCAASDSTCTISVAGAHI